MELELRRRFDGSNATATGLAIQQMQDSVLSAFSNVDHERVGYSVSSQEQGEVTVEASMDMTDMQYLFQETEGWRDTLYQAAGEEVIITGITPAATGVSVSGHVRVRSRADTSMRSYPEAKTAAEREIVSSFGAVETLDCGRIVETDPEAARPVMKVPFQTMVPYRESVLGLETQRTQFRKLAVPGEWDSVVKTC